MNKKGFVLIETLIVASVVILSLIAILSLYYNVLNSNKKVARYDEINDLYKLFLFRDDISVQDEYTTYITKNNCEHFMKQDCANAFELLDINYIIVTSDISDILTNTERVYKNTLKAYVKTLSLKQDQKILIAEYARFNKEYYASINYYK